MNIVKPQNPYTKQSQRDCWQYGYRIACQGFTVSQGDVAVREGNKAGLAYFAALRCQCDSRSGHFPGGWHE